MPTPKRSKSVPAPEPHTNRAVLLDQIRQHHEAIAALEERLNRRPSARELPSVAPVSGRMGTLRNGSIVVIGKATQSDPFGNEIDDISGDVFPCLIVSGYDPSASNAMVGDILYLTSDGEPLDHGSSHDLITLGSPIESSLMGLPPRITQASPTSQ